MTTTRTVYLAGPITGVSYEDCTDWREYAIREFNKGIKGISPMRAKEFLAELGTMPDCVQQQTVDHPMAKVLGSQKGIMSRDYWDCTSADIVLANLAGAETVSIGTVMEIAWCHSSRTPLVLVMEPEGNIHEHGMLREAVAWRVPTLGEGIDVVNAVLTAYVGSGAVYRP